MLMFFFGFAVFSYGETLYSMSIGYYRLSEEFFGDDYGRGQNGVNFNFTFYYFQPERLLGFFARTSFGTFSTGHEWKGEQKMRAIDSLSSSDLRICFAPSYQFNLGSKVSLPVTLGPVFTLYWEEGYNSWSSENYYDYSSSYYEAINLGIMGDIAIILSPFDSARWLFLKQGISLGWDFVHFEKGEMSMEYRHIRKTRYSGVPYSALVFSVYFGVGVQLE